MTTETPAADVVVLAHGLGAHPLVMRPLANRLSPPFGRVINWGYSSLWSKIEQHGEEFAALLAQLSTDESVGRIHVVTHSMGGVVARLALQQ